MLNASFFQKSKLDIVRYLLKVEIILELPFKILITNLPVANVYLYTSKTQMQSISALHLAQDTSRYSFSKAFSLISSLYYH